MLPHLLAVIAAVVVRLLLMGALHEDGLADFLDGFGGGGRDRQRILDIMKDSHIGTYGVLGLILYELLLVATLFSMPTEIAALAILAADPYSKMVTSQLIIMMPYARREEEAKSKTVYRKIQPWAGVSLAIQGLLPMVGVYYFPPRIGDVFPLPADMEQASRIYRRLLWSRLPVGGIDRLSRGGLLSSPTRRIALPIRPSRPQPFDSHGWLFSCPRW